MGRHQLPSACAVGETGVLKLEEDAAPSFFRRLGRGIRLKESGRAFLPHARANSSSGRGGPPAVASNNANVEACAQQTVMGPAAQWDGNRLVYLIPASLVVSKHW